jgi:hypothetical protein
MAAAATATRSEEFLRGALQILIGNKLQHQQWRPRQQRRQQRLLLQHQQRQHGQHQHRQQRRHPRSAPAAFWLFSAALGAVGCRYG